MLKRKKNESDSKLRKRLKTKKTVEVHNFYDFVNVLKEKLDIDAARYFIAQIVVINEGIKKIIVVQVIEKNPDPQKINIRTFVE